MNYTVKKLIAKIHIAKTQLGLDEDSYRAILKQTTGKTSTTQMSERELILVAKKMQRLGFVAKPKTTPKPLMQKLHAMLKSLKLSQAYADGIAQKMFNKNVAYLNDSELYKVVQALAVHQRLKQK